METHLCHAQSLKTIPPPRCHCLCISDSRECPASACLCRFSVSQWQEQDPWLRFQGNKAAPQYLSLSYFLDRLSGLLSDTLRDCHLGKRESATESFVYGNFRLFTKLLSTKLPALSVPGTV